MIQKYDAIIIGTGQACPALAGRLTSSGMRVAIAERHRFGGTCVNTGCIPTKALVASARAAHVARTGAGLGIMIGGPVAVDMSAVKARKDAIVGKSSHGVDRWLHTMERATVFAGHARFESERTVRIGDTLLEADKIFINVGARAFVPPSLKPADPWTNRNMMDVDFVPEHLVVVGGSYIGLEFAQMFRRFGSEVTVIEKAPRLIQREDKDVSDAVESILENEGIGIRTDAECISAKRRQAETIVQLDCAHGAREVSGSHLLAATGRQPNTHDLGLDAAGIDVDERGYIVVDDQLRTSVSGVWALGDCNGRGAFTHTAYNDFEIVAANLLDGDPRRVSDRIRAYALYVDPPLGRAGLTDSEVRASGRPALIAKRRMTRVGRAVEKGETQGFMKIIVDAETERILGATVLGVGGDEIIHSVLDVMYADAPYTVIQRAVHIHPTVTELIPTMLGELEPMK